MSHDEETLRSPKHYTKNEHKHIDEHGGDELAPENTGQDARKDPAKLKQNREKLGVDENDKTETMRKKHRGTFP